MAKERAMRRRKLRNYIKGLEKLRKYRDKAKSLSQWPVQ